jgi:hypothetical protein
MAAPTGAFVMKNSIVTVDAVQYANQVRVARFVPEASIQSYRTLVPDGVVSDVDSATWTFELTGLQINRTGGLARALRAMAPGDTFTVILEPEGGAVGSDRATATVMAVPVPFGGEQGSFATMELVFPVVGEPDVEPIAA